MSQLARLRERLAADRSTTLTHPLDDTVTMVHRPPTPAQRDGALNGVPRDAEHLAPAMAGLLADTLVEIREGGEVVAASYGMDLAALLGIEWVQGETRAVDVVDAWYGGAWNAVIEHGWTVLALASGRGADPLG